MENADSKEKIEKSKKTFEYLNLLRILGSIGVILIHVSSQNYDSLPVKTIEWKIMHVYDSLGAIANSLFVMISGVLFLNSERKISIRYLLKKILHLAIVYIFWQSVYFFSHNFYNHNFQFNLAYFKDYAVNLFHHHYHLWFLFVICGLYLLVPILRKITADETCEKYFLILSLIFTYGWPTFYSFKDFFSAFKIDKIFGLVNYELQTMNFHMTLGWTPYFVLGHYLENHQIKKNHRVFLYLAGIITHIFMTVFTIDQVQLNGRCISYDFGFFLFIEATAFFLFIKYELNTIVEKCKVGESIKWLSSFSFGIYLIHDLILAIVKKIGLNTLTFAPLFSIPIIVAIVFLLSTSTTYLLKRIPIINKFAL